MKFTGDNYEGKNHYCPVCRGVQPAESRCPHWQPYPNLAPSSKARAYRASLWGIRGSRSKQLMASQHAARASRTPATRPPAPGSSKTTLVKVARFKVRLTRVTAARMAAAPITARTTSLRESHGTETMAGSRRPESTHSLR